MAHDTSHSLPFQTDLDFREGSAGDQVVPGDAEKQVGGGVWGVAQLFACQRAGWLTELE